ncbi:MAG: hypothetical protein J6T33_08085 [Bacteroidales bacterium]|nr:hypothetical protein [Bacteroidales bacterium]
MQVWRTECDADGNARHVEGAASRTDGGNNAGGNTGSQRNDGGSRAEVVHDCILVNGGVWRRLSYFAV